MPILFWGHGALSVAVLLSRFLPARYRSVFVRVVCVLGAALGLALFFERRSADAWRTTLIEPTSAVISGIAAAAAWIVAGALPDEEDRWRAGALVGLGAMALVLFGETRWAVPALLFWSITSLVVLALGLGTHRRVDIWLGVVVSDLCFAAGMISHILDTDSWRLPLPVEGRSYWFLLAAAILRAGALPRFGVWRALGTSAAAALPLLAGGAFVLAAGPAGRPEPWAAVGLLVAALAQAIWGSVRKPLAPADFAGWPSCIGLALVFASPAVAPLAGAAAILAAGALSLWPLASGNAQPERGLVLTLAPLTAAFGAVVFVAKRAFDLATTSDDVSVQLPWIVVAALLPLVMAAGPVLGARVGRERQSGILELGPAIGTWAFVAGTVALGLAPGALELPDDVVGTQGSFLSLLGIGIVLGAVAGWLWTLRHPDHRRSPAPEPAALPVGPRTGAEAAALRIRPAPLLQRIVDLVALGLAFITFIAVGWMTYEGLSQGFL